MEFHKPFMQFLVNAKSKKLNVHNDGVLLPNAKSRYVCVCESV